MGLVGAPIPDRLRDARPLRPAAVAEGRPGPGVGLRHWMLCLHGLCPCSSRGAKHALALGDTRVCKYTYHAYVYIYTRYVFTCMHVQICELQCAYYVHICTCVFSIDMYVYSSISSNIFNEWGDRLMKMQVRLYLSGPMEVWGSLVLTVPRCPMSPAVEVKLCAIRDPTLMELV